MSQPGGRSLRSNYLNFIVVFWRGILRRNVAIMVDQVVQQCCTQQRLNLKQKRRITTKINSRVCGKHMLPCFQTDKTALSKKQKKEEKKKFNFSQDIHVKLKNLIVTGYNLYISLLPFYNNICVLFHVRRPCTPPLSLGGFIPGWSSTLVSIA